MFDDFLVILQDGKTYDLGAIKARYNMETDSFHTGNAFIHRSKTRFSEMVPASITLAALTRVTGTVRVMAAPDLTELDQSEVAQRAYEDSDGEELVDVDVDFFEEGTHTFDYEEQ